MDKDYICGERSEVSDWTQIRVTVKLAQLDSLTSIMSMVNNNLMIEDFSDIDLKTCYGDLIDENILKADKTIASVSVFVPAEENCAEDIAFIRSRMSEEGIDGKVEIIGVAEEDWANSWKAYYKPIKVGKRIVIVPQWEKYEPAGEDIIIHMDPGMAFGTGTHETTRLVIELLEKYTKPGCRVLDVGCGSGILAICAAKLGAGLCRAYDIDPMAVRVANENTAINNVVDKVSCKKSDLLKDVCIDGGGYDVVCANIVADIIIRMAPDVGKFMNAGGVLLASGIITERVHDVVSAMDKYGFEVIERAEENGWCALALKKRSPED
jgi:ribosomal protein L11 methyltransferase